LDFSFIGIVEARGFFDTESGNLKLRPKTSEKRTVRIVRNHVDGSLLVARGGIGAQQKGRQNTEQDGEDALCL
jgi:hypothetical protein